MTEREKVIRGLELCAYDPDPGQELKEIRSCPECPYYREGCSPQLIRDALALLKGQEARVVTTADFENNPNLDDGGHLNVWEEYKDGTRYRWNTINVNDVRAFTDIHRYWTSRPTPEQMRDTPWEGEGIK